MEKSRPKSSNMVAGRSSGRWPGFIGDDLHALAEFRLYAVREPEHYGGRVRIELVILQGQRFVAASCQAIQVPLFAPAFPAPGSGESSRDCLQGRNPGPARLAGRKSNPELKVCAKLVHSQIQNLDFRIMARPHKPKRMQLTVRLPIMFTPADRQRLEKWCKLANCQLAN